jgi:ferrous iron transport protein A
MTENKTSKTLKQAKAGESVRVVKVAGEGALRQRILDMGLTKGAEVRVRKVAPLGDPLELTVRGYELSLRKREAACIVVENV